MLDPERIRRLIQHDVARLAGGSAYIFALRIAGAGLTFVTQILLARWMGASELGYYVFAFSTATVFGFLATLGLPAAAQRFIPQNLVTGRDDLARGFEVRSRQIVLVSSCLAGVMLAFALWLFGDGGHGNVALILGALSIPAISSLVLQNAVSRSVQLFNLAFLPNMVLRQVFLLIILASLVWMGVTLDAQVVLLCFLAVVYALAIGQFLALRRPVAARLGAGPADYDTQNWVRTSLPLILVMAYAGYLMEINLMIAGLFLAPEQQAIYNAAFRTSNIVGFFMVAMNFQFAPQASRLFGKGDRAGLQRLVARVTAIRFAYAVAIVIVVIAGAEYILGLFGPKFVEGVPALWILVCVQIVVGAFGPLPQLLTLSGHQNESAIAVGFATVATIILTSTLTPAFGIYGAAAAVLLNTILWNVWLFLLVVRKVGLQPSILSLPLAR